MNRKYHYLFLKYRNYPKKLFQEFIFAESVKRKVSSANKCDLQACYSDYDSNAD